MAQDNKFGIQQLSSNVNFSDWKFRVRVLLEEFSVLDCIEDEPPEDDASRKAKEDWGKKNAKCKSLLVQCISDKYLEYIKDKASAKEVYETLVNTFERKGISNQLYIRKQLLTLKFVDGKLEEHFLKFDDLVRKLKSSGADPSENEIVCCLLLSMPDSYSNLVTVLETLQEEKLNVEFVKGKLLDEERKRQEQERSDGSSKVLENVAFTAPKNVSNFNSKFKFKCRNCYQLGHKAADCYKNKSTGKNLRNVRNFKKDVECFRCHRKGHFANECYSKQKEEPQGKRSTNFFAESLSEPDEKVYQLNLDNSSNSNSNRSFSCIVDSGATDHLVNDDSLFDFVEDLSNPINIRVAKENEFLKATKKGKINVISHVGQENLECCINDVLYVEGLRCNLLSVKRLNQNGFSVLFENNLVKITKNKIVYALGNINNNLYYINFLLNKNAQSNVSESVTGSYELWHKRYGHLNKESLKVLVKQKLVTGIKINFDNSEYFCEGCVCGKQTKLPFKSVRKRSSRMFETVHTDVVGPISPTSYSGDRFYITFLDDYSHFTVVFMLKSKSDVFDAVKEFVLRIENKFGKTVGRFRCDNGGEYVCNKLRMFCREKGISLQYTPPYTPELNGKAERLNRTLNDKARSMLADSKVPKKYWSEAVNSAAYVLNRSPSSCLDQKTPAELWYGSKPNVKNLRIFGSICYAHVPKMFRSKFDVKSEKCFFLSYGHTGYKVANIKTGKLIYSRDVIFDESRLYKDELASDVKSGVLNESDSDKNISENCSFSAFNIDSFLNETPRTFKELENRSDYNFWKEAVNSELESLHRNNTWTVVNRPENANIISCKWVFKVKDMGKSSIYKARLVARGFEQIEGVDYSDIYAPVAKLSTVRIVLSVSNHEQLHVHQMDVKSAFLNGELHEQIFMEVPDGVKVNGKNKVCKLNKAIYGLKQAPKSWNNTFNSFILKLNFVRSKNDECLYVKYDGDVKVFLLLYVDDIILASNSVEYLNKTKQQLMNGFEMKDFGEISNFLGIEIKRDIKSKIMTLNQKRLIQKVVKRFGVENCKPVKTPIEKKLELDRCADKTRVTRKPYRELVGCLMYIMLGSRPDIAYAISYFSQFQNSATDEHYNYLLRVLKYLNETIDYELIFKSDNTNLVGYSDADWANSTDRKSVSGYCFKVFGCLVSWSSKKQTLVALSSTESEYIALCSAACEMLWLRKILTDLNIDLKGPTVIYEDNQSCIKLVNSLASSNRTKHVSIKYYFVKDVVNEGLLTLQYVPSNEQLSDIFTKGLEKTLFQKFVGRLTLM